MQVISFLGHILTGAWTGYITNNLAIDMLFREYGVGKIKVGGVVVKTRKDFVENASSLVERDIINHHTLHDQLLKEEFIKSLENLVQDFLKNSVYKNTSGTSFGDIPGFDKSVKNLSIHLDKNLEGKITLILETLAKNIEVKDLISKKQINFLSENFYQGIIKTISQESFIEKVIKEYYRENKNEKFSDFLEEKILHIILNNIKEQTNNFHKEIKDNFDEEINGTIKSLYRNLEINKVLEKLETELSSKEIREFFGAEKSNELSKKLLDEIKIFLNSNEGKNLIYQFGINVFEILKNMDTPLLDLLSGDLRGNLESFLKDKLPLTLKEIISWVKRNEKEIENLIEGAIDDIIDASDGMKGNALKLIRNAFMQNVADKFNVVAKIAQYLETNTDIDVLSEKISQEIIKYLKETNVSTIIKSLEEKRIFDGEKLSKLIEFNVKNHIEDIPEDIFDKILRTKLGEILQLDLNKYFETYIYDMAVDTIKTEFLYTEKLTKTIHNQIANKINLIHDSEIKETINEKRLEKSTPKIKECILIKIAENKKQIISNISEGIENELIGKKIDSYLGENIKERIIQDIKRTIEFKYKEAINDYKPKRIEHSLDKLNNVKGIEEKATGIIVNLIQENLDIILKGNIKNAVADNLSSLKDEEIQKMMEEFMGKELKPITYLGAGLGGIVGAGVSFLNLPQNIMGYISNFAVYALLGYLTNVLAIWMIFKPYKSHNILGFNVQGVISKRKPKFAQSMGHFVDEELLNHESIKTLFNEKREIILDSFKKSFSKENYKLLEEIMLRYSERICENIYEIIKKYALDNKVEISSGLLEKVKYFELHNMDFSKFEDGLETNIQNKIKNSKNNLSEEIFKFIKSEKTIGEILPDGVKPEIKKGINKQIEGNINELVDFIKNKENLHRIIEKYTDSFNRLSEKPIKDIISENQKKILKQNISIYIKTTIEKPDTKEKIFDFVEENLLKEVEPDKKIGELFNGNIINSLNENGNYIIEIMIKEIEFYLAKNENMVANEVIEAAWNGLGFIERIGYKALGGDEIIKDIVSNFINNKLPGFFQNKKYELENIMQNFTREVIGQSKVGDLNINLNSDEIQRIIINFLSNKEVSRNIEIISNGMIESLLKVELKTYLKILSINNLHDVGNIFEREIEFLTKELTDKINGKKEEIIAICNELLIVMIHKLIFTKKVKVLTHGIIKEDIEAIINKVMLSLDNSEGIKRNIKDLSKVFIENEIKLKNIGKIFSLEELLIDISNTIEKLLRDQETEGEIKAETVKVLKPVIENINNICEKETKEYISDVLINSLLMSAGSHIEEILRAINFREVTEKEINNMEPKEIEDLFNSFGKKYFRKLELYGGTGGIFGFHYGVSILAFLTIMVHRYLKHESSEDIEVWEK